MLVSRLHLTPGLTTHVQARFCENGTALQCASQLNADSQLRLRREALCDNLVACEDGRRFGNRCYCNQNPSDDEKSVGSACNRRAPSRVDQRRRSQCVRLADLRGCAVLNGVAVETSSLESLRVLDSAVQALNNGAIGDRLCQRRAVRCRAGVDAPDVRVAFFLMLHNTRHTWTGTTMADQEPSTGLQLFRWLLEHTWHANHTFAVHVDASTPRAWLIDVMIFLAQPRFSNVFLMPATRNVVWSSIDVAQVALDGIRFLLAQNREWDVFINLSGTDVALMRPDQLHRYLRSRRGLNMLWANYFENINPRQRATHMDPTFAVCAERERVVKTRYLKSEALWFMPVKGQFWMTLTREFCEYLFSDAPQLRRFVRFLGLSHVPDEKLFPSMLMASPYRHTWLRVMDRYIEWEPEANHPTTLVYERHYKALTSGHYIFGRKVSYTHSKELLAQLFVRLDVLQQHDDEDEE
jgi:hypothetical protein